MSVNLQKIGQVRMCNGEIVEYFLPSRAAVQVPRYTAAIVPVEKKMSAGSPENTSSPKTKAAVR